MRLCTRLEELLSFEMKFLSKYPEHKHSDLIQRYAQQMRNYYCANLCDDYQLCKKEGVDYNDGQDKS